MKINKKQMFGFGLAFVSFIAGILLHQFRVGEQPYLGFSSAANWLIWIGSAITIVTMLRLIRRKEQLVDERMLAAAGKANRMVFLLVIIAGFIIMLIDGIKPIELSLGMFMAYLICGMMLAYSIAYKLILKNN